jgi:LAO/AO transport system kinase
VLLTVAVEGRGIDDLLAKIDAHHAYLATSGEGARRRAAGRRSDFVRALRDELDRRIAHALDDGACAAVLGAVEEGTLDPYAAMRRVFADPRFAEALLGDPGGEGGST